MATTASSKKIAKTTDAGSGKQSKAEPSKMKVSTKEPTEVQSKKGTKDMAKKSKATAKSTAKSKVTPVEAMLNDNEHLKNAVQQIEKQFGDGSIMALNNESNNKIRGISTGSLSLDMALGGQGLPCGRIIEIYGPESSGKTTLALHTIAEAQKTGGIAAFIDAEHAFDPTWAKKTGRRVGHALG